MSYQEKNNERTIQYSDYSEALSDDKDYEPIDESDIEYIEHKINWMLNDIITYCDESRNKPSLLRATIYFRERLKVETKHIGYDHVYDNDAEANVLSIENTDASLYSEKNIYRRF